MLKLAVIMQMADLITFAAMLVVWGFNAEGNPLIQLALSIVPADLEVLVAVFAIALKVVLILFVVRVARIAPRRARAAVLIVAIAAGLYGSFFNFANAWVGVVR